MLCLIPSYFRLIDRKKSSKYIAISKLALFVLFCSILSYSQLVNDVDELGETIYVICLIPFYCSVLFLILTYYKRIIWHLRTRDAGGSLQRVACSDRRIGTWCQRPKRSGRYLERERNKPVCGATIRVRNGSGAGPCGWRWSSVPSHRCVVHTGTEEPLVRQQRRSDSSWSTNGISARRFVTSRIPLSAIPYSCS